MISDLGYFSPELLLKHHSRESSLLPAISLAIHNWESVMSQDMRISSEIFDKNSKWKPTNSTHMGFFENDSFKTWDKLLEKCGVSVKLEVLEMSSVAIFFFNLKSGTAIEKTSTQQLHFNKVIGKAKMNIIVIVKSMFTWKNIFIWNTEDKFLSILILNSQHVSHLLILQCSISFSGNFNNSER